jgi:hypothetical protein
VVFADELAPSAANSPVGVVGVIDESAFTGSDNQWSRNVR